MGVLSNTSRCIVITEIARATSLVTLMNQRDRNMSWYGYRSRQLRYPAVPPRCNHRRVADDSGARRTLVQPGHAKVTL
jgi:hypothetical protein